MSKIETNVVKPQLTFSENLIDYTIISQEVESKLDTKSKEIEDFIKNNNGKGKSNEEKDKLYLDAQIIWKEYSDLLQESKYNFFLNKSQWKFLTDLINSKLEYDVNTVFIAIELTDLMGDMKGSKYSDEYQLNSFSVNATEVTYIYHLISTYKIKGLSKEAYTFSQILRKIGDVSKVFNYYETLGKNLSADVQDWVACFEDGVTKEVLETSN